MRSRTCALWIGAALVAGCASRESTTSTTLAPLVPSDALPEETVIVTTTVAPSSDPSAPLLAALPEGDCTYAEVIAGGEITFVVGDRLYGVAPDGTAARCLAVLRADQVGTVRWSPSGLAATLNSSTIYDSGGARFSGYDTVNARLVWKLPAGDALLAPTASSRTLVRRTVDEAQTRTEVTFLARTDLAVSHPAGTYLIGAGGSYDDREGIFVADEFGDNVQQIATVAEGSRITEIAADAGGLAVYAIEDDGSAFQVHQITLPELVATERASAQAPTSQLTVGPVLGTVAWKVGLCNSVTETRVLDPRDGKVIPVGTGTPIEGLSIAPVGWLDPARLVVVARPLGCDGPGDVWIWKQLDGSATLVAKAVQFPAVRVLLEPSSPVTIDPVTPPGAI